MKKVVVGIGNILLKDEGVGCHVAQALRETCQPDVEILEGGTSFEVVSLLEGAERVLIVDAVKAGGRPGQVYKFRPEEVALPRRACYSLHDLDLFEALMWVKCCGNMSDVVIIGVEPKEIGWGLELSAEVREKIPQVIEVILTELNRGEEKC